MPLNLMGRGFHADTPLLIQHSTYREILEISRAILNDVIWSLEIIQNH